MIRTILKIGILAALIYLIWRWWKGDEPSTDEKVKYICDQVLARLKAKNIPTTDSQIYMIGISVKEFAIAMPDKINEMYLYFKENKPVNTEVQAVLTKLGL